MPAHTDAPPTVGTVVVRPQEEKLKRWAHRLTLSLETVAAVIILLMMLLVLANVASRYLWGLPVQGTNEMIGFIAMPAVVFIGFVVAQARGQSIEADIVYQKFPRQIQREVRLVTSLLAALACAGFAWFGLTEAVHANLIGKTAPASDIFIAPIYWLVPVAFTVLTVLFIIDGIRAIRGRFDDEGLVVDAVDDQAVA